ncbi:methyl-accepting chemotaxis protein [Haloplanus sp.]|uniref:methyl-accepting chemotaxis protein n=1 Tax=Haloplanus sp. TaxID=1961696 RepID=UPI00260EDB79|nr:methyl-accepting chemotaxis protein [Haloplanus sp.]
MDSVAERVVPQWIRRRWAVKMGIAALVVIIAVGSVGAFAFVQTSDRLSQDVAFRMETASETQASALGEWTEQTRGYTRVLAESEAVQSDDPERISAFLTDKVESDQGPSSVTAVHYLDTSAGVFRAGTADDRVGTDDGWSDYPWSDGAVETDSGGVSISEPFVDPQTGAPSVAFVSTVPGHEGRALALVVDLEQKASEMPRPVRDSFTKVVDSDGTTVLSHRTDQIRSQNMGEQDVEEVDSMAVEKGLDGQSGYMEMEMGGSRMTMGYAPVEGTDWVLMTHSPKSTMFALQQQVSRNILLVAASSLLGFGVIIVLIKRRTIDTLDELTAKANALEAGNLDTDLRSARVDELGQLYAAFGSMRDSLRESLDEAESARERAEDERKRAEEERERSEALVDHLEATADEYSAGMQRAADGDLSVRLTPDDENDAMAQIAEAFNGMATDLERTVAEIREFADEVAASSQEVTAGAEEIRTASREVAESVQEISAGADRQQASLRDASDEMQTLSGTVEEVAASANQVASTAQQASDLGVTGQRAAADAIDEMETIEANTDETIASVEGLVEEVAEVSEIVDLISDIADQTNQLALNASIEAARAGDAGEGFAVVADQVKELAAETTQATEQIDARIERIQSSTTETADDIREMEEGVSAGASTVEEALDALEELARQVEETNTGVQEITRATDDQASATEETVGMIDEVTEVAERTSNEAANASAAAEEQTSALTEVADTSRSLAEQTDELQRRLDAFTVGTDTGRSGAHGTHADAAPGSRTATDGGGPA